MNLTPLLFLFTVFLAPFSVAAIGDRFPSEKKVIKDPTTGVTLAFLTTQNAGDRKIYPTHPQWTADDNWLVFRSNRVPGEAMAVNEDSGAIVQVTEGGYFGMLMNAHKSMKLYLMRDPSSAANRQPRYGNNTADKQIIEVQLESLFRDSAAGKLTSAAHYQRLVGTVPASMRPGGDLALDANEDLIYFNIGREEAARHLAPGEKIRGNFGPRKMGAGPGGIASMNIKTGKIDIAVITPFKLGHIQSNPWLTRELVFCWETGGKSPQRMWTAKVGEKPQALYPEKAFEWVTHEAIISRDEVAFALMGHRKIGTNDGWGPAGTRAKPTGLGIINLRNKQMRIAGQTHTGSGLWHVHGSADGRWAVGDDFDRNLYLIDRRTSAITLLTSGHKKTARDHVHPTFNRDGSKIQIQSAMLAADDKSLNIVVVYLPESLLSKTDNRANRFD